MITGYIIAYTLSLHVRQSLADEQKKQSHDLHWKTKVIILPTVSSLVALQIVVMPTCSTASDDKVGIIETLGFQW